MRYLPFYVLFTIFYSSFIHLNVYFTFRMGLAFRVLCWIHYFPSDLPLALDLATSISDSMSNSIACDIEEGNNSDLKSFFKNMIEMAMEGYDKKTCGALKNGFFENWKESNMDENCEDKSYNTVKELLECKCPNWFDFVQGRRNNIYGIRLAVKGVWRGYCKIQTKEINFVYRTTSLTHTVSIKIARGILDNNYKNEAKMTCIQAMELPEVLLKHLMNTLEWLLWSTVSPQMYYNKCNFVGDPELWPDLCYSDFEMNSVRAA